MEKENVTHQELNEALSSVVSIVMPSLNDKPHLNQGQTPYFTWAQEPVSRKPRKFFGPEKPFSINLYLKSEGVYTPETSYMKKPSVHINNMWIKQLCHRKVRDFETVFRVRKHFGTFEKRAPGPGCSKAG